jgi:hypothetical protein
MNSNSSEFIRDAIQAWIEPRHHALLEYLIQSWGEGIAQIAPDEELIQKLQTFETPPPITADTEADLGKGLDVIESSKSQGEVLKHLLEALQPFAQPFAERCAIFVIKQGLATFYTSRGFETSPSRNAPPVTPPPDLEDLIQGHTSLLKGPGSAYRALLSSIHSSEASAALLLPLRLRRKTVAVLLADSGQHHTMNHANHIRALTHAAEVTLALLAGTKEEEKPVSTTTELPPSAPTQIVPEIMNDATIPPLDPRIRANAERSARVLVGDIELYFPAKVAQGRQNGNLYAVLKEELDRSRSAFVDRYGLDLENNYHVFYQTVISQLCEGAASRLGPAPWVPKF